MEKVCSVCTLIIWILNHQIINKKPADWRENKLYDKQRPPSKIGIGDLQLLVYYVCFPESLTSFCDREKSGEEIFIRKA